MAFVSSLDTFESLPTRPPTPPRESTPSEIIDETLDNINDFLESSNEVAKLMSSASKKSTVSTPEQTPPSSAPATAKTSSRDRERKRVDFAPFTSYSYHNTPDYHKNRESFKENASTPGLKSLPPSRERSFIKSRSILKPSRPCSEQSLAPAHNHRSLGEMLESMLKSLAKDGTEQRVDAYVSMLATFKAYKSLPDADMKALKEKLRLLLHFIRRDIAAVDPLTGKADAHLMTRSMRFLMCLFVLPDLKPDAFDTEESASILDHSISVLQSPDISKSMANHHLELVAQQKFGTRVMTPERVHRILDTLNTIEIRIDGNNIVGRRVAIYQRLVEQAPGVMAAKASDWLEHLFSNMLSSFRDVREPSTSVSVTCAVKLGGRKDMAKATLELLSRKNEEKSFCDYLIERLSADINDKELCSSAFHVWSVPILFLRALRPSSLDKPTISSLLQLPHAALNRGTASVKATALLAWNKLVFAEFPSLSTPPTFRNVLRVPIRQQLKRQKDGDFSKSVGHVALSSYCALLYYSLRPDASFEHLDLYWDEYVSDILSDVCVNSQKHAEVGCKILTALLTSEEVWDENRANHIKKKNCHPWDFEIRELPRLDARWVRSRFSKILELFVVLLGSFPELCTRANPTSSPTSDTAEPTPEIYNLWTALLAAVVDAGSQEITPSLELKSAVAGITNLLSRIWSPYWLPGSTRGRVKTSTFTNLLIESLEKLGPAIFTDKILAKNSKNAFEAISTPSQRSRSGGPVQSPALHIIGILAATIVKGHDQGDAAHLAELITSISKQALASRPSRNAKLSLLADLTEVFARSVDNDSHIESDTQTMSTIDALFSGPLHLAFVVMSESSSGLAVQSTQFGQDYKYVLRILAISLRATQYQFPAMEKLYSQCVTAVKREAGDGGVLLAMTEPHAEMFGEYLSTACKQVSYIGYAEMILDHDVRPKNRRVIELGRKSLWGGITSPVTKNADLEYKHIYPMLNKALGCIYEHLDDSSESGLNLAVDCVVAINNYLRRVSSLQGVILRQIQDGVALLLRDHSRKIFSRKEQQALSEKVQQLWEIVLAAIGNHPRKDSGYLQAFDTLLAAGLSCRRISIVNATVALWNETFGAEIDLEYPPQVAKALRKLKPTVELQLPGMLPLAEEIPDSPLSIEEADEDTQEVPPAKSPSRFFSPQRQIPTFRVSPSPLPRQTFTPDRLDRSSPFRRATTPRSKLRHEDSQIQFEAIQSSPIADQDSQVLTERQKEVAERQRLVTAPLFHNISSPARKRASDISSDPLHSDTPDRRPSTPVLQPALDDEVLGSSPTTASVSRRQSLTRRQSPVSVQYGPWKDEEDIPSSPPRGDDESDSGVGAEPELSAQAISPLRLQLAADSSLHEMVEKSKHAFSDIPEDLPIASEIIEHRGSSQQLSSYFHDDREPRSSVEREMVHAQIVAEALGAAGVNFNDISEEQDANTGEVAPTSSIVVQDRSSDSYPAAPFEQMAVAATSDEPVFDGSTTDPISSEVFVVNATAPETVEDNDLVTAVESTIPAASRDDLIPDSQFSPRPQDISSLDIDASRIVDSFPAVVDEDPQSQPQHDQSTQEEASQGLVLEDSQRSLSPSMDPLSQSQTSTKRKRGRPSIAGRAPPAEQIKRVKMDFDLDNWKLYAGSGNKPAKPPAASKLVAADDDTLLDLICIHPDSEKSMRGASRSPRNSSIDAAASLQSVHDLAEKENPVAAELFSPGQAPAPSAPVASSEQLTPKKKFGKRVQNFPVLGRRQSDRSSPGSPVPEQNLSAAPPQPSVPSLRRATSSRLSEVLHDSPVAKTSSPVAAKSSPATDKTTGLRPLSVRKGRQSLNVPSPTEATRSSSRLSGTPTSPQFGHVDLPRVRRTKRTLSQSQDVESLAKGEATIINDTQEPVPKRTRSMALPAAPKSTPVVRTPSLNRIRASRAAFVQVTPGEASTHRAISKRTTKPQVGSPLNTPAAEDAADNTDSDAQGEASEELTGSGRKILTPKSIMARLKGILADCKNIVFGSQERREMDDIMFELKNEVFSKPAPVG